jgi:DHA3 family macrolide efflux protein-like MFS transporter
MVLLQTMIEPSALGRVMSFVNSIALIATPLGLFIAGPLAQVLGVAKWFFISGVFITLVGVGCHFVPQIRNLEKVNEDNQVGISNL